MSWLTGSNAFCRSQKTPPTSHIFFSAESILFIKLQEAKSVDDPFLNPNCSLTRMLL